jgi:chromosome segregation ATPase
MQVKDAILAALKELVLPELAVLKQEQAEIRGALTLTNKRLDDLNAHLVDQSRRIDTLSGRIDAIREELGGRIDILREDLSGRIDSTNGRIDALREELGGRIDSTNGRIDETNKRLDRLYEIVVRRDEHQQLTARLDRLEQEVSDLKKRLAA